MKAHKKIVFPLLVIALALAVFWYLRTTRAAPANDRILGNGVIEATEIEVSAKVAGRIATLPVKQGDQVKQGELIATLEAEALAAQVAQAEAVQAAAEAVLAELRAGTRREDMAQVEAQLHAARQVEQQARARYELVRAGPRTEEVEQVRAGLRQAEVARADAQRELTRLEALEAEGAVSRQQVDLQRTRRDSVAAARDAAQQRLTEAERGSRAEEIAAAEAALNQTRAQTKAARAALALAQAGPRVESIDAAQAKVKQAQAVVRAARDQFANATVRAPADGVVLEKVQEAGEFTSPGTTIVRLGLLDRPWLRVYVPEPTLGRVKLGQQAEVFTDTYPGKRYRGRVVEIAQEPEFTPKNVQTQEERVKLVFGVKIELKNPGQELKPGMPADAVIYPSSPREEPAPARSR